MSQIDWSKAPEGATHYAPKCGSWHASWYLVDEDTLCTMLDDGCDDEWDTRDIDAEDREELLPRLVARPQEWNGTGNPPAGTVCEMTHSVWGDRGWESVTINYCSAEYAITTNGGGEQHWHMRNIHFRVIRTPEQIAADEREAAIEEMWRVYWQPDAPTAKQALGLLWDAGYRKQSTKQDGE